MIVESEQELCFRGDCIPERKLEHCKRGIRSRIILELLHELPFSCILELKYISTTIARQGPAILAYDSNIFILNHIQTRARMQTSAL